MKNKPKKVSTYLYTFKIFIQLHFVEKENPIGSKNNKRIIILI